MYFHSKITKTTYFYKFDCAPSPNSNNLQKRSAFNFRVKLLGIAISKFVDRVRRICIAQFNNMTQISDIIQISCHPGKGYFKNF